MQKKAFMRMINENELIKEFSSSQFISLPFIPNKQFELQENDISYRIKLKNSMATTKWVWSIKSIYKMNK